MLGYPPIYRRQTFFQTQAQGPATRSHDMETSTYLPKLDSPEARTCICKSSRSLKFFPIVEFFPSHPPNLLKFRSPCRHESDSVQLKINFSGNRTTPHYENDAVT